MSTPLNVLSLALLWQGAPDPAVTDPLLHQSEQSRTDGGMVGLPLRTPCHPTRADYRDQGGLGLRRLVADTAADKIVSNRVLASNGFTQFGREHAVDQLEDGSYSDLLHWQLLLPADADGAISFMG